MCSVPEECSREVEQLVYWCQVGPMRSLHAAGIQLAVQMQMPGLAGIQCCMHSSGVLQEGEARRRPTALELVHCLQSLPP